MKQLRLTLILCIVILIYCPPVFCAQQSKSLPYADIISRLFNEVTYSGFEVFVEPKVGLNIDFKSREWHLTQVHQFNSQGQLNLIKGRYGLCAELAAYVYQQLTPHLGGQHLLRFVQVAESSYFWSTTSNHIVLLMFDQEGEKTYLIDPSFKKYGHVEDFEDYRFLGLRDSLGFMRDKTNHIVFKAAEAFPLRIAGDLLISFSIEPIGQAFDKDHFRMVISSLNTRQAKGEDLLVIVKDGEALEVGQQISLLEEFFSEAEIEALQLKLTQWLKQLVGAGADFPALN